MRRISILLLLGSLVVTACGPSIATRALGVTVDPGANNASPVPVELVVVYDPEILPLLLEMTARQWFDGRDQLLLDHPRGVRTQLWEFVPGQEMPMRRLPLPRDGAVAAFIYADYFTPGPHRVRIDPYSRILIRLTPDEVVVEPVRK